MAWLLLALVAVLVLPAAAGAGSGAPMPHGGVVPARGLGPLRPPLPAATADASQNLVYHGGPVMRTNTVYAIYWLPAGTTMSASYRTLIDGYFQNLQAASGAGDNVYSNNTQYSDTTGPIADATTFGGSYVDTANAIPNRAECAAQYSSTTGCIFDADAQAEINRVLTATGWTPGPTKEFFLFTPNGVGSCYDAAADACAYSWYCAFHSEYSRSGAPVVWANQPYPVTPAGVGTSCDSGEHPNGDVADAAINLVSHEHIESITDPDVSTGWYDDSGDEISDKCAWDFGSTLGSNAHGAYNQSIGGGQYFLQQEWSNQTSSCILRPPVPAPAISGLSRTSGRAGDEVTITGTHLTDASAVRFGTAADPGFAVDSDTQITAHVPDTALTGAISVTTPGGKATTASFHVLPTLDPLTTTSGAPGASVTLTGKSLAGTTKVTFGAPAATASIASVSSTQVRVTVPSSAVSGPITVTNAGGSTETLDTFTVLPKITSFSPSSAAAGSLVTINGAALGGATVTFGGPAVAAIASNTATKLVVQVPAGAATGAIAVGIPGGGSAATGTFKPLPRLASPAPVQAGDVVALAGTNLLGATKLALGSTVLTLTVDSALQVSTTVPLTATTGTVTVTTPAGSSSTTLRVRPTVDSFTPDSGLAGTQVTLAGRTLKSPSRVAFAGGATAAIRSSTATSVTVTVPSGALTGPVTVWNAGGSTASVGSFTVRPRITSFSPGSAAANGAVTITGTGLAGASSVTFGGVAATVDSDTATRIVARVPANAATGAIAVVAGGVTATSTSSFRPLPKLAAHAPVQAGDDVTLAGTNLLGATKLTLGSLTLPIGTSTGTTIATTIPDAAVTGPLRVTTPTGSSTLTLGVRPSLDALTDTDGAAGDLITISGKTLKSPTRVLFGGVPGAIRSSTPTRVVVAVPSGALTGPITVRNAGGSTDSVETFHVLPKTASAAPNRG